MLKNIEVLPVIPDVNVCTCTLYTKFVFTLTEWRFKADLSLESLNMFVFVMGVSILIRFLSPGTKIFGLRPCSPSSLSQCCYGKSVSPELLHSCICGVVFLHVLQE